MATIKQYGLSIRLKLYYKTTVIFREKRLTLLTFISGLFNYLIFRNLDVSFYITGMFKPFIRTYR